jgi:hypothetical protein
MRLCSRWDLAIHARLVIHDDETPMSASVPAA